MGIIKLTDSFIFCYILGTIIILIFIDHFVFNQLIKYKKIYPIQMDILWKNNELFKDYVCGKCNTLIDLDNISPEYESKMIKIRICAILLWATQALYFDDSFTYVNNFFGIIFILIFLWSIRVKQKLIRLQKEISNKLLCMEMPSEEPKTYVVTIKKIRLKR